MQLEGYTVFTAAIKHGFNTHDAGKKLNMLLKCKNEHANKHQLDADMWPRFSVLNKIICVHFYANLALTIPQKLRLTIAQARN